MASTRRGANAHGARCTYGGSRVRRARPCREPLREHSLGLFQQIIHVRELQDALIHRDEHQSQLVVKPPLERVRGRPGRVRELRLACVARRGKAREDAGRGGGRRRRPASTRRLTDAAVIRREARGCSSPHRPGEEKTTARGAVESRGRKISFSGCVSINPPYVSRQRGRALRHGPTASFARVYACLREDIHATHPSVPPAGTPG